MTFQSADLRAGRLIFLLDLEWAGQVYRVAEDAVELTLAGEDYSYTDGLQWQGQVEDRLNMFGIDPSVDSAQLTVHLAELVDVPARIAEGHTLGAATGVLRLWLEGTTEFRTILDGEVRLSDYGSAEDPIEITLEEAPELAPGRIPHHQQRIQSPADFDADAESVLGQYYPVIIGYPGGSFVSRYGSPALIIEFDDPSAGWARAVVSAERCIPGEVTVVHDSGGNTSLPTPTWEYDSAVGFGRSVVNLDPGDLTVEDGAYYVGWYTSGGGASAAGIPSRHDPTVPMRALGEVLLWLLERSGARVDWGRMAALEPLLAGYLIDTAIVAGDKERVSPLDWLQDQLLPLVPLSARRGPGGLHYVLWRWDATEHDAVIHLDADDGELSRLGFVEYSDRGDLYQEIRLDYYYDARTDTHGKSITYTGDPLLVGVADTTIDPFLEEGWRIYARGERLRARGLELSTDVITEDATAHLVLQGLARRHGLQTRLVRYAGPPELVVLAPGAIVTLTDTEIALASEVGWIEAVEPSSSGRCGVAVRLLARVSP